MDKRVSRSFFPEATWGSLRLHQLAGPGLRITRMVEVAGLLEIKVEDLARRCGLSRPTFHRRKADHKPLSLSETDALLRHALLFAKAFEVFEDETQAREWLKQPQYGLGGAVPLDLATTTFGYREVEKLLTRIDHGVYAEPDAWRIDKAKWARQSLTGLGASLEGGRWNPAGVSMVYFSRHLAMAAMEKLVHLPKPIGGNVKYVAFGVTFNGARVETLARERLPEDWTKKPPGESTQRIGLAWATGMRSAILKVPSAIIPSEINFLLNPAHPDFRRLKFSRPIPFAFDPRLA